MQVSYKQILHNNKTEYHNSRGKLKSENVDLSKIPDLTHKPWHSTMVMSPNGSNKDKVSINRGKLVHLAKRLFELKISTRYVFTRISGMLNESVK